MVAVSLFNIYAPKCEFSLLVEELVRKNTIYGAMLAGNIFILVMFFLRGKVSVVCTSVIVLLVFLSVFSSTQREFDLERLHWEFEGEVTKKYNSDNHGARTITVNKVDYEYISYDLWDFIEVGYNVKKASCENMIIMSKITN